MSCAPRVSLLAALAAARSVPRLRPICPRWGVLGPARLPAPIVKRLNSELNAVLGAPDLREMLAREGATVRTSTPESFGNLLRSELVRWRRLIKEANIQMQ